MPAKSHGCGACIGAYDALGSHVLSIAASLANIVDVAQTADNGRHFEVVGEVVGKKLHALGTYAKSPDVGGPAQFGCPIADRTVGLERKIVRARRYFERFHTQGSACARHVGLQKEGLSRGFQFG